MGSVVCNIIVRIRDMMVQIYYLRSLFDFNLTALELIFNCIRAAWLGQAFILIGIVGGTFVMAFRFVVETSWNESIRGYRLGSSGDLGGSFLLDFFLINKFIDCLVKYHHVICRLRACLKVTKEIKF